MRDIDITDDQPGPRKGAPLFGPGLPDFLGYLIGAVVAAGFLAWVGRDNAELAGIGIAVAVAAGVFIYRIRTGSWP